MVGCCGDFSVEELNTQLNYYRLKKSPGLDELTAEHLLPDSPSWRSQIRGVRALSVPSGAELS